MSSSLDSKLEVHPQPTIGNGPEAEVSAKKLRQREQLRLNRLKCKKSKNLNGIRKQTRRRDRQLAAQMKDLQHNTPPMMQQSSAYLDTISQLQGCIHQLLQQNQSIHDRLRSDSSLWKLICLHRLQTCKYFKKLRIGKRQVWPDKPQDNTTSGYLDAGDQRSQFKGKKLSTTKNAINNRRRARFITYLINTHQRYVVDAARENNSLKSKFEVLSNVKENLKKEVHSLRQQVQSMDLSKPADQTLSEYKLESIPAESQLQLEVQEVALKRSFMTPLPGFLNPVVNLQNIFD